MGEQRAGDPGTMLAVLAPLAQIEGVIADRTLDLVVANKNAPKQSVLSGSTKEVERAAEAFNSAGMKCARLPVAAAFHSRFVADAAIPFRAALESVKLSAGAVPVFANTTAAEYPADAGAARDLLANQLAKPVAFVEQIRAMSEAVCILSRSVPALSPTKLADAILGEAGIDGCEAFALDASGGKRSGVLDLANTLSRLLARGHRVNLAAWESGSRCRPASAATARPGLTVALTGANYVTPREPRAPSTWNGKHEEADQPRPGRAKPDNRKAREVELNAISQHPARSVVAQVAAMPVADPNALAQALLMTQQSLAALQRMQEQTAALHKQFLETQESAQRTLHALVEQQQALLQSGLSGATLPAIPHRNSSARATRAALRRRPQPVQTAVGTRPIAPATMDQPHVASRLCS